MKAKPEPVDQVGEMDLLADGQRDALSLGAVAQGRVVDPDVGHQTDDTGGRCSSNTHSSRSSTPMTRAPSTRV